MMGSSLLIQARSRGPRPSWLMASPASAMRPGTRRMVRRTGPGVKRRIWAMSRSNAARSMSSSTSFSSSRSRGTPSRNRSTARTTTTRSSRPPMIGHVVRDEVAPDDEVAGGRPEQHLAVGRHPLVEDEGGRPAGRSRGSGWRPAGTRAATASGRGSRRRATVRRAACRPRSCAPCRPVLLVVPWARQSTSEVRARPRRRPGARGLP